MGRLVDGLLRRLTRHGLRRGLGGGGWPWLVIAGAAYVLQRARRPDDAKTTLDLRPGDSYLVRVVAPDDEPGPGH